MEYKLIKIIGTFIDQALAYMAIHDIMWLLANDWLY